VRHLARLRNARDARELNPLDVADRGHARAVIARYVLVRCLHARQSHTLV
jgi:hypothetical protein